MKRVLAMGLGVVMAACAVFPVQAQTVLKVRGDDGMPFNGDGASEAPGYAVEILKLALAPEYKVDYALMPWKRALADVEAGTADVLIGGDGTEPGVICPKEPIGTWKDVFMVKADSAWTYDGTGASLEKVSIGFVSGYYDEVEGALAEHLKKFDGDASKLQPQSGATAAVDLVKKLKAGRMDVLLNDLAVTLWHMKSLGIDEKEFKVAGDLGDSGLFACISAKNPDAQKIADLLDKRIQELRASGEIAKIMAKYGLK